MDLKLSGFVIWCLCFGLALGKFPKEILDDWFGNYKELFNIKENDINDDNYNTVEEPACQPTSLPPRPDSQCCGVDTASSNRIVGGEPTLLNQYPWLVLLEYKLKKGNLISPRCGGSLISSRFVLTAAHCAAGDILEDSVPYNVVLGEHNKYNDGPDCIKVEGRKECTAGAIKIRILKTLAHPKFNAKLMVYDIALILMQKAAPYTEAIRPICLPNNDLGSASHRNLWLYSAGWGTMKQKLMWNGEYIDTTSSIKRHLALPFVTTNRCQKTWGKDVGKNHICAGGIKGQDVCMGDSGGPLMHENDGQFEAVGVISYGAGDPCGKENVPGVYTNVYQYRDWLDSQMKKMLK